MGNEESAQSKKTNSKSTEFECKDLFSLKYISDLFQKITNQDIKNQLNPTLDSVFFSSLIENLISSQSKTFQLGIHSELEKSFFLPLIHDIDIDYDYSRAFNKCFDEMRSTANTILECENISRKRKKENMANSFQSIQTQKTPTSFLEDFFTIPFDSLLSLVHVLEVSDLATYLNYLNDILLQQKNWSLDKFDSPTIISVQKLINTICQIDKFRVPEIQLLVIKFLFNIANAHGSVNNILSILKAMLSFPVDFPIDINQMDLHLQGPKSKVQNIFSFPFEISNKIISFSIGSNVLVLSEEIGLIQFIEPDPLIIPVNVCEDSILLDSYHFIYIFSIKLGTIQCFTNKDLNIDSMRILDISKYLNVQYEILACGKFDKNIGILQKSDKNKFIITVFNNDLEKYPNKVSEIEFTLSTDKKEEFLPKLFYFNKNEVHFIFDNMIDKPFKIIKENNSNYKIEEMPDLFCSSFIPNKCPISCFRNVVYSISQNNGQIFFIKNQIVSKHQLKTLPFTFTSINLPVYNDSKITVAISLIINELSSSIDSQLNIFSEGRYSKYVSFIVSSDNSTIDLCSSIIQEIIPNEEIDLDIKMPLISLLLKIIAINLSTYCIKFFNGIEKLNEEDKLLFKKIRELIELATFSKPAIYSPLIIESVSFLISSNFHYLYYPDYSLLNDFIRRVLSNNSIKNYLILNYMLLSTSHCFFYMFSKESNEILKEEINDKKGLQQMFNNSLSLINEELQFLNQNEIDSNEEFIIPYFEFLLSFAGENISFDLSSNQLMQNLIFRLMLIDDFPLIALNIVDKSIPIVQKYIEMIMNDQQTIDDDYKYSNQNHLKNKNEEELIVLESEHNSSSFNNISKTINFEGSNNIHLSFDPNCQTDPNNSSLEIYDISSEKKKLLHTFAGDYWIHELDVMSNSILINFTSNDRDSKSGSYWGFKVICSPNKSNEKKEEFNPCLNLFYFNLLVNTLGRLTYIGLQSIPPSIEETQCKFILEGDLLEGVTKLFNQKDIQIQLQSQQTKAANHGNKPLTRGLSNGISFDATNGTMKYPDEFKKEFINDLISDKSQEKETIGSRLLKFMYKAVKAPHLIRPNPSILLAEKYMIAALMKQLGFINSAISFATVNLTQIEADNGSNESFVVPPNLDKTWKSIYKMRTLLYRSYQKTKEMKISKQEKKNENKSVKLHENFDAFINEIIIKCKFLLFTEPILKKRKYETENYDMETIEKTINELLSFITSDLLLENLSRMVERRTQKMKIRIQALSLLIKMMKSELKSLHTTKITYLYPLKNSLKLLTDHSDVKSVPNEMIDELNENFFVLFKLLISNITDPNESDSARVFYIKMLSVSIKDIIPTNKLVPSYLSVAKFIQSCSIDSIESFISFSCLWRILGLWTLEFPSPEIINALLSFSTNSDFEYCQYHSILLLSALSQTIVYNVKADHIFKCFNKASPRVIVATLIWLSCSILNSKDEINEIEINGCKYNLVSFIHFLLKAIGSSLCGGPCLFISDDSLHESHMIVAEEIIAFLRILIRPHSPLNELINKVFHEVLSHSIDLTKYAHNNDESENDDQLYELIAVFTVLGKEIISFHNSGYSIFHTKETTEIVRISSFEPMSGKLKYFMMKNNFNELITDKMTKYVPSARLPSNPNDFIITAEEAKLFVSIQNEISSTLDNLANVKFSIFSASFTGFLTICLQNKRNADTFIKNADLTTFLNCANKKEHIKKAVGVECLIYNINQRVIKISNINKKRPSQNDIESVKLPYSLVFNYDPPHQFVSLYGGKVKQNQLFTSSSSSSLFIGNHSLPNDSLLYFEVKIASISNRNIIIGLTDHNSAQNSVYIFGINLKDERNLETDGIIHCLNNGDVIGCMHSRDGIEFFYNGIKLKYSIPSGLIDEYIPVIYTKDCQGIFEYNFGQTKFVTNIIDQMESEILIDSLEKFDVKVPTDQIQLPKTNLLSDDDYDEFINNSRALWEVSKIHPSLLKDDQPLYFSENHGKNNKERPFNSYSEFSMSQKNSVQFNFFIGQPVIISQPPTSEKVKELNSSLLLIAQIHINNHGTIVDMEAVPKTKRLLLTIEYNDQTTNKKWRFQIDSQYVQRVDAKFMTIVENASRINSEKVTSIVPSYLSRQKQKLFESTRALIIRMCRFLSLIFIDFYRFNNNLSSYFEMHKTVSVDVFLLIISNVFKFIHKPKISSKWTQYRNSDFIFADDENDYENFTVNYLCLCDTHMLVRYIRALIYKNPETMDEVIMKLILKSIDHITNAPNSSRNEIFNLVSSKKYIIETPHPMNNSVIKEKIQLPQLTSGFIPVSHSLTSFGSSRIVISGREFKETREFDYLIFPPKDCSIEFKPSSSSDTNNNFGLRLCIFPLKSHLKEKVMESPLGGIHDLFILLSAILSEKKKNVCFAKTVKFLKQEVIPRIASLMNHDNYFVDLFAFEIIQPILMSLHWNSEDVSSRFENAFHSFTANLHHDITKWSPLHIRTQQGLLISLFTRLLILDISAGSSEKKSKEDIEYLYDTFIKSKVNKNSSIYEQVIEAIAICVALGFDMPISIKFPSFLIAETWAESIPYSYDVFFDEGQIYLEKVEIEKVRNAEIEFVNEEWLPKNCALCVAPIKNSSQEKKQQPDVKNEKSQKQEIQPDENQQALDAGSELYSSYFSDESSEDGDNDDDNNTNNNSRRRSSSLPSRTSSNASNSENNNNNNETSNDNQTSTSNNYRENSNEIDNNINADLENAESATELSFKKINLSDTIILTPGKKAKIYHPFSAYLINTETNTLLSPTLIDSSHRVHLIITGYPTTHELKREKFVSNYHLFLQHVSFISNCWNVRMDESLSRILKSNSNIYKELTINVHERPFLSEPLLSNIPSQIIRCRLQLFHRLEEYMPNLIKVVDLGSNDSLFGGILASCRSAISTTFKLNIVKSIVQNDLRSGGADVNVKFNRFQASLFHSKPENPAGKPILDQFMEQVPISSIPAMKRPGAPWRVDLIGEGATDAGGPGRDLFTEACLELMNPSLGLFIENPNKRVNNINGNQELLIPNPQPMNDHVKNRYFYAGVLMALCYTSSIPEPFKFPRFVWDYLTNKAVSIEDIYDVDLQFKQLMTSIENCEKTLNDPSQFSEIFAQSFQVQNSLGEMVDLIPGGSCIPVTFNKRLEFVQRCKNYRIKEFNDQLNYLRKGFNLIFAPSAASILTPWEIELLICGDNQCPVEELKKNCSFDSDDRHVKMLWEVLDSFTPEERMLFIKFGCGRMGLPPPGMKWQSNLNIRFKEFYNTEDSVMPLPTAVTCNSKVTIPRYSSTEWMAKKIRTAITMGADIDQDRNAHINDLEAVT